VQVKYYFHTTVHPTLWFATMFFFSSCFYRSKLIDNLSKFVKEEKNLNTNNQSEKKKHKRRVGVSILKLKVHFGPSTFKIITFWSFKFFHILFLVHNFIFLFFSFPSLKEETKSHWTTMLEKNSIDADFHHKNGQFWS